MYSKIEDVATKANTSEEILPPLSGRSRQLPKITRTVSNDKSKVSESIISHKPSAASFESIPSKSRVSSAKPLANIKSPEKQSSSVPVSAKSIVDNERISHYKRYTQEKKDSASDPMTYLKQNDTDKR